MTIDITSIDTFCHVTTFSCKNCGLDYTLGISGTVQNDYSLMTIPCPLCQSDTELFETDELEWKDLNDYWMEDVRKLLKGGNKVAAIRVYRTHTGKGLKESKDFIEQMPEHEIYKKRNNRYTA